jgi:hypothetical protein
MGMCYKRGKEVRGSFDLRETACKMIGEHNLRTMAHSPLDSTIRMSLTLQVLAV